jgi:hypothetical protein
MTENITENMTECSKGAGFGRTDVEVGDLEALLRGELRHHLDVVRVGDAQGAPAQQRELLRGGAPQLLQTDAGFRGLGQEHV